MDETKPEPNAEKPPVWPPNWIALLHALSRQPSQFILLVLLLFGLGWFVHTEGRHREAVYAPLLAACLRVLEK
jgi:hypothetical protein